jgi:wyosine [tRNA(Phe)-imidazoG37] synthetase (radical SAM superfamily)
MKDYIAIIAEKIKNGKNLAIYTLSTETFFVLRELKVKYDVLPSAIIDRDESKQSKTFSYYYDLPIYSFKKAIDCFPDLEIYIASLHHKYQIIGELLENDFNSERIINYVPVIKKIGCDKLQNRLLYTNGIMKFCVNLKSPSIPNFKLTNIQDLCSMQLKYTDLHAAKNIDNICGNCGDLKLGYFPEIPQLVSFNLCNPHYCNFNCIYCFSKALEFNKPDTEKDLDLEDILTSLINNNLLDQNYELILSTAGEPTLHPKKIQYYNAFKGYFMVFNTNGSNFDEYLFNLMNEKKILVQISIDSGTSDTFKIVKGADAFDKVVNNIGRFNKAKIGTVMLKYIFIEGKNDKDDDINGFIDICKKHDINFINLSIMFDPHRSANNNDFYSDDSVFYKIKKMKADLEKLGKICFLNLANEAPDTIELLQKAK